MPAEEGVMADRRAAVRAIPLSRLDGRPGWVTALPHFPQNTWLPLTVEPHFAQNIVSSHPLFTEMVLGHFVMMTVPPRSPALLRNMRAPRTSESYAGTGRKDAGGEKRGFSRARERQQLRRPRRPIVHTNPKRRKCELGFCKREVGLCALFFRDGPPQTERRSFKRTPIAHFWRTGLITPTVSIGE